VQIARDVLQFKTVRRGERQYDIVFGGGRLQFEIELAAESFAQRQPPGAVDLFQRSHQRRLVGTYSRATRPGTLLPL
jgi:hypothetical protein